MKQLTTLLLLCLPLFVGAQQQMLMTTRTSAAPAWRPSNLDNLAFWYRSDTLVRASGGSITTTDNTQVAQWDDISGNGYHVTQATSANQPRLQTNELNGFAGIEYDGGDWLTVSSFSSALTQPNTIIVVFYSTGGAGVDNVIDGAVSGSQHFFAVDRIATRYRISAGTNVLSTGDFTSAPHFAICVYNGASSALYIDNSTTANASGNAGAQSLDGLVVGSFQALPTSGSYIGLIYEVIGYSDLLSSDERAQIDTYLSTRYGL